MPEITDRIGVLVCVHVFADFTYGFEEIIAQSVFIDLEELRPDFSDCIGQQESWFLFITSIAK